MAKVKAVRNFYGTGHGSVSRGDVIDVSEALARALKDRRLVVDASGDDAGQAKNAPEPKNKMQPPARNKADADDEEEYEPGIVRSSGRKK